MRRENFLAMGRRLLVALLLVAFMSACTQSSPMMAFSGRPSTTPANPARVTIAGADESAVISFAANENERQYYEALMAKFHQQHPEIRVQFVPWPESALGSDLDAETRLRQMASVADTMLLGEPVAFNAAYSLQDLQPLMGADPAFLPADFWPGALEACQDSQGRSLGLPVGIGFQGIFYDRAAFDAAGLAYPQPGWTLDDFRQIVTALSSQFGDANGSVYAESFPLLPSPIIAAVLAQEGGEIIPEKLQNVLDWYIDLVREALIHLPSGSRVEVSGEGSLPADGLQAVFQSEMPPRLWPGRLSDAFAGRDTASAVPFVDTAFQRAGFVPFPAATGLSEEHSSPAWARCAVISRGTRYPHQAWKWLDFLSQHWLGDGAVRGAAQALAPARISTSEASGYWQQFPAEIHASIRYLLEHAWYEGQYPQSQAAAVRALWRATGNGDFAAALIEAQTYLASLPPPSVPDMSAPAVSTPQPTQTADMREIRYFYDSFGAEAQSLQAIAVNYQRLHPDINVRLVTDFPIPSGQDRLSQLSARFDCFTAAPFNWQTQALDRLLALDAFLDAEDRAFIGDFTAVNLDLYRYGGSLYALPAVNDVQMVAYNADLLARRGLTPPAADWTFDDFVEMVNAAASTDPGDLSYGFLFNAMDDLFLAGRGTLAADFHTEPPDIHFDDAGFVGTLGWLQDMHQAGAFFLAGSDWAAQQQVFVSGRVAFWTMMLSDPGDLFAGQRPGYTVGIAPLPFMPGATRLVSWGTKGHFISSQARDPQACWDWVKFLSGQATVFKGIPARHSIAASAEWQALVGEENAPVYRQAFANAMHTATHQAAFSNLAWPLYYWQSEAVSAALQRRDDYRVLIPGWQQKGLDYLACMQKTRPDIMTEAELHTAIHRCARQADPAGKWRP
ncbi:MAG: extracellular solute-binding protein [Chloroflexota bacterium]